HEVCVDTRYLYVIVCFECYILCFSSLFLLFFFFFSSRRRHTRSKRDWSSDVCSSDLCWRLCGANDQALCVGRGRLDGPHLQVRRRHVAQLSVRGGRRAPDTRPEMVREIGRASCREREEEWGVDGEVKKKRRDDKRCTQ